MAGMLASVEMGRVNVHALCLSVALERFGMIGPRAGPDARRYAQRAAGQLESEKNNTHEKTHDQRDLCGVKRADSSLSAHRGLPERAPFS